MTNSQNNSQASEWNWSEGQLALKQFAPKLAIVLGSGMSHIPTGFREVGQIGFADVPGLTVSTVAGHAGQLAFGYLHDKPLLLIRGRLHYYEGNNWERVTRLVRLLPELGIETLLLTNAAGGIRDDLNPGSLMWIRDHIPWLQPDEWKKERAPSPYDAVIIDTMLHEDSTNSAGVYGGVTGPCYETPAEIRALRAIGADAVGMSTIREAVAAKEAGLRVAGLSMITNKAAGLSSSLLSHQEVIDTARDASQRLSELLVSFVQKFSGKL